MHIQDRIKDSRSECLVSLDMTVRFEIRAADFYRLLSLFSLLDLFTFSQSSFAGFFSVPQVGTHIVIHSES